MNHPEANELSERELDILRLVATGASNKEIAQQLFISSNTVKVHLRNIFNKIGATSRTEAAMYAVRIRLVQGAPAQIPTEAEESPAAAAPERAESLPTPAPRPRWQIWALAAALLLLASTALIALLQPGSSQSSPTPTTPPIIGSILPQWELQADLPTPRSGLALAAFENRIYAIGGQTPQGVSGTAEYFDVETGQWAALPDKPLAVADVAAVVIGGEIFVPGGRLASGAMSPALEVYDLSQNTWSQRSPLPIAISGYALTAYEGSLYLFGGWDGQKVLSSVYEYDPSLDQWRERSPMPTGRAFAGAAIASGRIYVLGGWDGTDALTANEVYSPTSEELPAGPWSRAAALPEARYAVGVTTIADIIYVLGGLGQPDTRAGLLYFSQNDTWQQIEAAPQPIGAHFGLVSISTRLHLVGGVMGAQPSAQHLAYQAILTLSIPIIVK